MLRTLVLIGSPVSAAQIAADCGLSTKGTRAVLENLVVQGVVGALGQARSQLFCLTQQHPMRPLLVTLFEQEHDRWTRIEKLLTETFSAQQEISAAWLYGSVARGEDRPHSDVELVVVLRKNAAPDLVRDALRRLEGMLELTFAAVVITPEELVGMKDDALWWDNVVRGTKILKGLSPAYEAALLGARSA